MGLYTKEVVVKLRNGLHARPAALFVQEANRFSSDIYLVMEDKRVSAKSIMGVMSLAINQGTSVTIEAEGPDAAQAVESLAVMISKED
ncbi:MAG: hypothetical protein BAA01_13765 [Bacillus thermozeamaize]|jgi:phosphotransferase system HPr (HPr) family protein|uniref:Phosphocarrier protein HPr n=1 Tax=Bacillus thermozeamaize TaxID=230954 RepID=A0A1Y3PKZ4_9BACI|nr:MAG: hypothetical protein BAA01_13765 [Bacillus thermozeamaize]